MVRIYTVTGRRGEPAFPERRETSCVLSDDLAPLRRRPLGVFFSECVPCRARLAALSRGTPRRRTEAH